MRTILQVLASVLLFCWLAGCASSSLVKGHIPEESSHLVAEAQTAKVGTRITVRGEMIDKCPVAGCWFHLRDGHKTLRVDTKTAGFTVIDVPLQTDVTVSGVIKRANNETILEATGIRY